MKTCQNVIKITITAVLEAALLIGCSAGNLNEEPAQNAAADELPGDTGDTAVSEAVPNTVTWEAVEAGTVDDDTAMEIVSAAVDAQAKEESSEETQPETAGIDILQFALENMDGAVSSDGNELQIQYPFEGDGGTASIDWETMTAEYPGLSFILSIPAAGIEAPVIVSGEGAEAVTGTATVNEDINSGYFIPKLLVRDDDCDILADVRVFGDEEFLKANHYIYLYTENATYEYKVFASFTESEETAIEPADFTTEIGLSNYIDAVYQQKSMDAVLDEEQIERIYAEHQILAIQIPNSDGTLFDVQAVITGKLTN